MEALNCFGDNNVVNPKTRNINVDMKDMILTPQTCVSVIIEILKAVLYEKSQLPYPYSWLKNALSKRKPEPNIHSHSISIIVQKYFNLASNAFRSVEDITTNLSSLMSSCQKVQEVVILFGSTPYTPKEVFTIKFPDLAKGHIESNHKNMLQKKLHKVLRNVFLSDQWLSAMRHQIQVTNTFIMVKKVGVLRHEDDYFEHYKNFVVPTNVCNTVITLNYDKKHDTCCENLRVYGDTSKTTVPRAIQSIQSRNVEWYQAKAVVKGFQDFFIEKVSVSEIW